MPTGFLKLDCEFRLKDEPGPPPVKQQLADIPYLELEVSPFDEDNNRMFVTFRINANTLESGSLTAEVDGDDVLVKCNAVVKINIRAHHVDAFMKPGSRWVLLGVNHLQGEVSGLDKQDIGIYTYDFVPVKTGKKVKELA